MNRRAFVTGLGAVLAGPLAAGAEQAWDGPSVGLLPRGASHDPYVDALRRVVHELGYVERQTVEHEYRWAEGRSERLPRLAAELVHLKVVGIVTQGEGAGRAAK